MREVNFSIPSVNKASVNITTTLYDRRALDCTSTLPLINSLNHLAYLTTSSARIRDILTVDGGIERLVCILKEGRSQDLMEMWKWSLAFQCVVNIGVRGSENVRTRVVEADMVPVIATILDNYIKVFDKARARMDAETQKHSSRHHPKSISANAAAAADASSSNMINDTNNADQRSMSPSSRRQAPPPSIEIPRPLTQEADPVADPMDITSSPPRMPLTSPPERSAFGQETHNHPSHHHHRHHHHHHHHHHHRHHHHPNEGRYQGATHRHRAMQPLATTVPTMDTADGFNLRPVRDTERLPSMLPRLHTGFTSQPDSPTTPNGVLQTRSDAPRTSTSPAATIRQRPALHQHPSASGESDDGNGEGSAAGDDTTAAEPSEPIVGLQNQMEIDGVDDRQTMLEDVSNAHDLTVTDPSEGQDAETFNITHRSAVDGSLINNNDTAQTNGTLGLSPARAANNTNSPVLVPSPYAFYYRDRTTTAAQGVLTAMPRDEDVLMSLQLLAYVSKYCNLRSFFQHSHLVPKLKIDRELSMLDEPSNSNGSSSSSSNNSPVDNSEEDEYLLPDDVNIFPLVEKFTVRHHSKDMRYWACVVMRNLCRKDESRGGIRQCAYYKCGKWEEFQRQFAKCRRCRRTKYCSKDCQKAAWVFHRHWCHTTP